MDEAEARELGEPDIVPLAERKRLRANRPRGLGPCEKDEHGDDVCEARGQESREQYDEGKPRDCHENVHEAHEDDA